MRAIRHFAVSHCAAVIIALLFLAAFSAAFSTSCAAQGGASRPASGQTDTTQVRTDLKEILSQPEFQPESADSPMARLAREMRDQWEKGWRWLQERWRAFARWLERLFRFAGPAGAAAGSVFSKAFAAVFILLGGWLIAWLIRNFWIQRQRRMAQQRTAYDEAEDAEAMITEPNAWMQQAEDFASSQDYRRAFRAVFLAILLLLDQAGIFEFDRARTNGDYLRLVRRKNLTPLYNLLYPLVLEFDRRWYGRSETGSEDYRRIQQEFARVRELITEQPTEAAPIAAAGKA